MQYEGSELVASQDVCQVRIAAGQLGEIAVVVEDLDQPTGLVGGLLQAVADPEILLRPHQAGFLHGVRPTHHRGHNQRVATSVAQQRVAFAAVELANEIADRLLTGRQQRVADQEGPTERTPSA